MLIEREEPTFYETISIITTPNNEQQLSKNQTGYLTLVSHVIQSFETTTKTGTGASEGVLRVAGRFPRFFRLTGSYRVPIVIDGEHVGSQCDLMMREQHHV